jgi:hypothetical protein
MSRQNRKLRVGLKYCGGCDPEYDRVALAEDIARKLHDRIDFVSPESKDMDLILAVQGCSTACADLSPFVGLKIYSVTNAQDADRFIAMIKAGQGDLPEGTPL